MYSPLNQTNWIHAYPTSQNFQISSLFKKCFGFLRYHLFVRVIYIMQDLDYVTII